MRTLGRIIALALWTVALSLALSPAPAFAAEVLHHAVAFKIDPDKKSLRVRDTLEIAGTGEVVLHISDELKISSATSDGVPITYSRDGAEMIIIFAEPGNHTLELSYEGFGLAGLSRDGGFVDPSWVAHPQDQLSTWELAGETPKGQTFVLPGKLEAEDEDAEGYRAQYKITRFSPAPMLITGPFQVDELMSDGVRIRTYFHPELSKLAQDYLKDSARYIQYYAHEIGSYPYPGFAIISGPAPVGWGLPGMTYMGKRVLTLPFIRYTSLPHEIVHNWWGNAVDVDYATGNWAEGLTTYQADHAMAEAAKPGGGKAKRMEWLRNYAALPADRDKPISAFRSKIHDAAQVVGYGKTAYVFHMLKTQLGAETFTKALQRFYQDNQRKIGDWSDIQAAFEAESGQNLNAFFEAWISRTGAPDLVLKDAQRTDTSVTFTIEQRQPGPAYPLDLTVQLDDQRRTVNLRKKTQSISLSTLKPVSTLTIDPNGDIFRKLHPGEAPPILRDITLDAQTQLMALGDGELRDGAFNLAARLLQTRLRLLDPNQAKTLIVSGPAVDVRAHLKARDWSAPPADIAAKGDARAWAFKTKGDQTVLAVEAEDLQALKALSRVLPHYKRRSFVVMKSGKTIDKGTWESTQSPLTWKF
ncbi:M1 family aminopeptidase [Magnetovibrio sp. PR-2]|uniref:M1 family metallopeptidase n=1 Tax=Magnetovibrio sp. PR-2 TaxID=3120356 RepID=UPI002FCDFC20